MKRIALSLLLSAVASPAWADASSNAPMADAPAAALTADAPPPAKKENDGTDPTAPAKTAKISFEHLDLSIPEDEIPDGVPGDNSNTFTLEYQQPFGHDAIKVKVPIVSVDVLGDSAFSLGDTSVKLTHVAKVTRKYGLVFNLELVFNTASRPELGTGKDVIKPGAIYAMFLKGGSIFAPSFIQAVSYAGKDRRANIDTSTMDFYFVPKLKNPRLYMTIDPAVTIDWVSKKQFGNGAVTMGYKLGPMLGGKGQVFIKPSVGVGGDRPVGWGLMGGFALLSF